MTIDFERIKRAIARVDAQGNGTKKSGTAFYVGGKYALTALHVVADTSGRPPEFLPSVRLHFLDATEPISAIVVDELWSADDDWAVLECEARPDAEPIELGPEPTRGATWETHGFPEIAPDGMGMKGEVRDAKLRPPAGSTGLPPHPMLQLFGQEASAGMGARMHGFSGAPCLVDGKAVGILRSTLIEEMVDGQSQRLLFTQAGTVYATPAHDIVDWQADHRNARLPGTWAPPKITTWDFVVLLSQREPDPTDAARTSQQVTLRAVARRAYDRVKNLGLNEPYFLEAAEAVSSEERLRECVRALCGAKVVVLDATDFEPAIMFLAGIRAVVRRGVTLLSVGGDYALGKELAIPFNVTDANIVAHSREQNRSTTANSVTLLTERIRRGVEAIGSPLYLDLPVYDAIRRLPVERRGIIPSSEGVLVLCPFDQPYAEFWDDNLKQALAGELGRLRNEQNLTQQATFGVSRSFELNSPRLVTHAVYEAIRRIQTCIVDLSSWKPNVLFELGVRLAASGERTVCIIEEGWQVPEGREKWLPQCSSLESLFVAEVFKYSRNLSYEDQAAFSNAYGPDAKTIDSELLNGGLHKLVEQVLDVDSEPASRPVFLDLLDQAATFAPNPGSAGRSKPVGLFPGNRELVRREQTADFERLLAAWLFASNRFSEEEILGDAGIRGAVYSVIQQLFRRHTDRLAESVKKAAGDMMQRLTRGSSRIAGPRLAEARALKERATALRNHGELRQAQETLDEAIRVLATPISEHQPTTTDAGELRAELADTYGMKGGIFRRAGELYAALKAYETGAEIEDSDKLSTTYNRSNVITLSITEKGLNPTDHDIRELLANVIRELESETAGTRRDEWWAWSDLGQFYLLDGEPDKASASYKNAISKTGATADEIKRHITILGELADKTAGTAPEIAANIRDMIEEIPR